MTPLLWLLALVPVGSIVGLAVYAWLVSACERRARVEAEVAAAMERHPSRAGRRAVSAARAAALRDAEGCVQCAEMPCDTGPHFSWVGTWVDAGGDQ